MLLTLAVGGLPARSEGSPPSRAVSSKTVQTADCVDVQEHGAPLGRAAAKGPQDVLAPITAIAISPDGGRLALAQEDRVALVCRADDGQVLHRFAGHDDTVSGVAFSPDGRRLATSSFDHTVRIWDAGDPGKPPRVLRGHDNWVFDVAFSPDGKRLASCGYDKTVRLWDAETGAPLGTLSGHTAGVRSLAFSPDGKLVASAGSDRTIRLWSLAGQSPLATLTGHEGAIRKVAFSPDGKLLASAGEDAMVKLWYVNERRERYTLSGHVQMVWSLAFSPGGAALATGGMDMTVRLWDLEKATSRRVLGGHHDTVTGLCFSPDGGGLYSADQDKALLFWKARVSPQPALARLDESASFVLLSPDGKWCVSGGKQRVVHVRDMADGRVRHNLAGHKAYVSCAAFSGDGRWLVTGSHDKTLRVWDSSQWAEPPQIIQTPHEKLRSVAWVPDGRIVSGGWDGTVCVWKPGATSPLVTLPKQGLPINRLAVSPDGKHLATASGDWTHAQIPGEVKIWNLDSGTEIGKLGPHLGEVKGVHYAADGRNLVTYGSFQAVRIWHADSRHEFAAWTVPNSVNSMCLTGTGNTLALGDVSGGVELRSLSGAAGPVYQGHKKSVLSMSSSTDGTLIATASSDDSMQFWSTGLKPAVIAGKASQQKTAALREGRSAGPTAAERVRGWGVKPSLTSTP
ncbi:MAG TPA: WD40 repeat domain-containing protein [Pirellulales bacterium]|jgi:WD40 repeat protein|nr:WD40 repeat domain-containing protein [Pirellulales bacterium]